jgi:D-arabinitol dehydrogenase (NADP+)
MKAVQITAPGQAVLIDTALPEIGPQDVLIKVASAGICGTDIHILHGTYEAHYPIIPGHEFSGTVAAVGPDVVRYAPGDRVTADPNIPCNRCPACQQNRPNQCHALAAIGVTQPGGFAEYIAAPEGNVFPIGDLLFPEAALVEPLACVVWGLKRLAIQPGDSALIMGAGPMGCLLAQAVQQAGATTVAVTDIAPQRLKLAQQLGADHALINDESLATQLATIAPEGFDIVADATGLPTVLEQSIQFARPRGKIWVFGVCPPDAKVSFVPYEIFRKDLSIIGSFAVNRTFSESIALIQSGAIDVKPLISHQLPLDEFASGFDLAQHAPDRMKIQFSLP